MLYTGAGNGASNAIFSSGTSGQGNPPPCRMLVSSAGAGYFMVLDSSNNVLFIRPTPPQGTLIAGQTLSQVCAPLQHTSLLVRTEYGCVCGNIPLVHPGVCVGGCHRAPASACLHSWTHHVLLRQLGAVTCAQNTRLYSPDNAVYLVAQPDGNLNL